jgi:formylglycine-generating enzyme required for sulfatase activity
MPETATPFFRGKQARGKQARGKQAIKHREKHQRQWHSIEFLLVAVFAFAGGVWWNRPAMRNRAEEQVRPLVPTPFPPPALAPGLAKTETDTPVVTVFVPIFMPVIAPLVVVGKSAPVMEPLVFTQRALNRPVSPPYRAESEAVLRSPLAVRPLAKPKPRQVPAKKADEGLVRVPGGIFQMGDVLDGFKDAQPHQVQVGSFQIGRHEVTLGFWERVAGWGREHGYSDLPAGFGKGERHPVSGITWEEAVKWCNARSEMEKLTPCYYADVSRAQVLRTGETTPSNACVRWDADGYRLPTEAEWERAARGGQKGKRFPWGDEISHKNANYSGTSDLPYDHSQRSGIAAKLMGSMPYTAPVGSFTPNGFGLHDMAGNVSEWCWDFYDRHYGLPLTAANTEMKEPRGPELGESRVVRGGSWRHQASEARCASRFDLPGAVPSPHLGFRVVRR